MALGRNSTPSGDNSRLTVLSDSTRVLGNRSGSHLRRPDQDRFAPGVPTLRPLCEYEVSRANKPTRAGLYLCSGVSAQDPAPRLGEARCWPPPCCMKVEFRDWASTRHSLLKLAQLFQQPTKEWDNTCSRAPEPRATFNSLQKTKTASDHRLIERLHLEQTGSFYKGRGRLPVFFPAASVRVPRRHPPISCHNKLQPNSNHIATTLPKMDHASMDHGSMATGTVTGVGAAATSAAPAMDMGGMGNGCKISVRRELLVFNPAASSHAAP